MYVFIYIYIYIYICNFTGPGLVFIVYPAAFSSLTYPAGQIFAFLFFFMLITLAVDSQVSIEKLLLSYFQANRT